jgi:division protein 1
VCLTGSDDSTVRLWDLRRVEDDDDVEIVAYSDTTGSDGGDGEMVERPNGIRNGSVGGSELGRETAFVRALEGHSKAVTSMYFEDECLVSTGMLIPSVVHVVDNVRRSPVPLTRRCASGISPQDSVS